MARYLTYVVAKDQELTMIQQKLHVKQLEAMNMVVILHVDSGSRCTIQKLW